MSPDTQRHQHAGISPAESRNRLAAMLKRVNVGSRLVPATAAGRKTLNLLLLAVVLPLLLLGVALVNSLTSSTPSAADATPANSHQVDLAWEGILKSQAQALASIAADPILVNAALVDDIVDDGIDDAVDDTSESESESESENKGVLVSQRLGQLLQVHSGFESLAQVNATGAVAATAGILHQDFYLWQNTPAFYDSLNRQGRPSISPLKFGVLALDEDGNLNLSDARIERLVFTAGVPVRSTAGSQTDGMMAGIMMVGIMKSETLVDSVEKLLRQKPEGSVVPDSRETLFPEGSPDSPVSKDANPGIQLVSTTPGEVASVSSGPPVPDAISDRGLGSNPAYTGRSPFEETGTSRYSAWPSLTPQHSRQLLADNLSLVLAAGSILLAMTAAWFIIRAPRDPQPAIAAFGSIAPTSDTSGPSTYIDSRKASQRLVVVQESVRREMADYLHGHIQSKLVALSLSLGICQSMLTSKPDQASLLLEQVQVELQKVQDEDLRRVSHELYPAIVKMGLVPAMRSLTDRVGELLETALIIDADVFALDVAGDTQLPEEQRLGVYRIAEEALNNALKHARATHIEVKLICNEIGNVILSVTDDGCGFDVDAESYSQGIAMMTDYAEAIGGQTEIRSAPEKGTTVSLALFMEPPQQPS